MQKNLLSSNRYSLTEGGILNKLLLISLPIIGMQIIQMTYNLTDMFWLGRVGPDAVASSGTVGMYLWMSMAFMLLGSRGAEIGVSQNIGRGDRETARELGQSALSLAMLIGLSTGALMFLFRRQLIGFFNLEPNVAADAETYLAIVCAAFPFNFAAVTISSIFNGSGNSRAPFMVTCVSLGLNITLDPLFIFALDLGVAGAAMATVVAQSVGCCLMIVMLLKNKNRPFENFRLFKRPILTHVKQIVRWTIPISLESFLFTFLTMSMVRMIATWGTEAVAAQRVGSQIESLSWLIGGGYSIALTSFVGQNFGAGKWKRIHSGFRISFGVMGAWGLIVTAILFFGAETLMRVFLPNDPNAVAIGASYVRILAATQLLACLEGIAAGAFRGMGRTTIPSAISISVNAFRVVLAYILARTSLGMYGVFWAISLGAAIRGLTMFVWYMVVSRRFPKNDVEQV